LQKLNHIVFNGNNRIALRSKAYDFGPSCTGEPETDECIRTDRDFQILPPLVSAQIETKNYFNFKFGRIEIRARLPNADWIFPQIFLEPSSYRIYGKTNYQSGQMRIAFTEGSNTCDLKGGILLNSKQPIRTAKLCSKLCSANVWSKDFHIYSLNWTPDFISLSVDGEQYCSIDPNAGFHTLKILDSFLPNKEYLQKGTKIAPFDEEFFLKIGYGVGGLEDFPDNIPNKPWQNGDNKPVFKFWSNMINKHEWLEDENSEFQIDYIKVFSI